MGHLVPRLRHRHPEQVEVLREVEQCERVRKGQAPYGRDALEVKLGDAAPYLGLYGGVLPQLLGVAPHPNVWDPLKVDRVVEGRMDHEHGDVHAADLALRELEGGVVRQLMVEPVLEFLVALFHEPVPERAADYLVRLVVDSPDHVCRRGAQPAGGVGQRADPLADHLGVRVVRLELNPLSLGVVAAKLLHEQCDVNVGTHVTPSSQTYGQHPFYSRPRFSIRPAIPRQAEPATLPTGTLLIPFGLPADKQRTPSRTPPTSRPR